MEVFHSVMENQVCPLIVSHKVYPVAMLLLNKICILATIPVDTNSSQNGIHVDTNSSQNGIHVDTNSSRNGSISFGDGKSGVSTDSQS